MKILLSRLVLFLTVSALASAHFVFVVPDPSGKGAQVFLSETLTPTAQVDVKLVSGTKLSLRSEDGKETLLELVKADQAYRVELSGTGTQIIHGSTDLGMLAHGQDRPSVLFYYPKTIVGDAFAHERVVGGDVPVEIVPLGKPGAVTLELLVRGKPQAGAEINVISPDGSQKKIKTNDAGVTETLTATGRYGAWARSWEAVGGERDGKKYDQTRNYATLVFDAPASAAPSGLTAKQFGVLPQATSSFGEVISDGWLYVYGGHIAKTHTYSTEAVSGQFERLNLAESKTAWERLPDGPSLQGMNLAAYKGKIYRIGGMGPRNEPGKPAATFSVADCARYDPATKTWEPLPPLPEARSSHDVAVIGDTLIVVGGWMLNGSEKDAWAETMELLDLSAKKLEWKSVNQPFKRRALMSAADSSRLYVVGGFDDRGKIVRDVSIYDLKANHWTNGPALPGGEMNGFAPAACMHDGVLYVSVADGSLYRLANGQEWEKLGMSTPRLAHRIGYWDKSILISGGAAKSNNFDLIESIAVRD